MKTLTIVTLALLALVGCTPATTLEPCQTEDQETACYWDAANRGNGLGTSFTR